jgi:hypothetical protein
MNFPGHRHNRCLGTNVPLGGMHSMIRSLTNDKDPDVKPKSGDANCEALVLGLLKMKGEGFFRRAPQDKTKLRECAAC